MIGTRIAGGDAHRQIKRDFASHCQLADCQSPRVHVWFGLMRGEAADPFAPLTYPAEIANRSAMDLADCEIGLHDIQAELPEIYMPIAEREIMKHNDGVIPAEAASTLEKMRVFAAR